MSQPTKTKVSAIPLSMVGLILVTAMIAAMIAHPGEPNPTGFAIIVCFAIGMILFGTAVSVGYSLDKQLPSDWLAKMVERRDEVLAHLGHPIPRDAVDRRWLKEIEEAFSMMSTHPVWDIGDPVWKANELSRRDAERDRVRMLIKHAREARGVRLPSVATARED